MLEIRPGTGEGHPVVLVHGIGRTGRMFRTMERALRAAGYEVAIYDYPSRRGTISCHAKVLLKWLCRRDGMTEISFVTHSMGALVVRMLLADPGFRKCGITVRRAVLIAPPNAGSAVARRLQHWAPYKWFYGPAGQELVSTVAGNMPGLECPFGIIAGGRGGAVGFNPLLAGDNDGTVTVAETRLAGARDVFVVPALHALICRHPVAIAAAIRFLATGSFAGTPCLVNQSKG